MELTEFLTGIRDILELKLFTLQDDPVTILSLVIFFLTLTIVLFLGSFARRFLQSRFLNQFDIEPGLKYAMSRVAQYTIVVIGVLVSFQFVAIDLTSLAVIFGLLSVGIGFGLQNITANFISGLIIMFERPITVGDRVDVNGIEGDVMAISIRSTKILTMNNTSIIVPNTQFVENSVINFSHGDPTFRLHIYVGVSYSSNLDNVLQALNEVADEHPKVMKKPKHQVHLTQFGDSSWDMELRVWIPEVKDRLVIRNELNQAIIRKFNKMKIEIPFPQRDLHVRSSVGLPIEQSK
ncbi:mechanosensitive ion channel [soil metagenome]